MGLTGTLSKYTKDNLLYELSLPVLAEYPIEQAIEEGVIVDYQINVIKVPLDNIQKINYKGKFKTEKQQFDYLSWIIDKMQKQERDTMFMRLARMRIIQNSVAKRNKTIQLLKEFKNERILVFAGTIGIADNLGIPSFHSKSTEKQIFQDFVDGTINHLAVVRIGTAGTTYCSLNRIIINYTDSNSENLCQKILRAMTYEYKNPNKKAIIQLITSSEPIELKWVQKALTAFDSNKIKYV